MKKTPLIVRCGLWVGAVSAGSLAGAVTLFLLVANTPIPEALHQPAPAGTVTLLDTRGEALAELADAAARSRQPVALDAMGADLARVTIALEDRRFYQHHGVDGRALLAALGRDLRHGRVVSGASTITEQLVKLSAPPAPRTLRTKAREAAAAWKLERAWTKDAILARYLNALSYGNRLVGPEAAAWAYFGKPACGLSLAEAVYLAGLPQAPTRLNPWRHPAAAEYRFQRSVRRLARLGVISNDQARTLADAPPRPGRFLPERRAPHFVDALLAQRGVVVPKSSAVRTTLDAELQQTAETLLRRHLETLEPLAGGRPQAAVVVLENASGAVRALVGSGDYAERRQGQVNGALRRRSAGSTLKPFLYLTALERRQLTAASVLPDTAEAIRATFADYDPQNYFAGRHLGPVRVRQALGSSLNVPAVVALGRHVGARQAFFELERWGFGFGRPFDDYGAGFILGNSEIRLLDLAAAYAGLARGGLAQRPRLAASEHAPQERIASAEACAIITDILGDPEARRATFGAGSPLDFPEGVRVAVKTGTSSGFRDKWCVGFTGRHTVAVWAGYFDGRPMEEAAAIHAAAPLWHALTAWLLEERHDPPVPAPVVGERLVRRAVCPFTGLLPAPEAGGPAGVPELFLAGTEPTASAAEHFSRDAGGGPPRLRLPAEYAAWCAGAQNRLGAVAASDGPLAILSPVDGAGFLFDAELPAGQQMVELKTNAPEPAEVRWRVNGEPLPRRPDGRALWTLTRGQWRFEAALPGADGAAARVTVE